MDMGTDRDMGMMSMAVERHQAMEKQRKLSMKVYKEENMAFIYISSENTSDDK